MLNRKKLIKSLMPISSIGLVAVSLSGYAMTGDTALVMQVDRYSTVSASPTTAQINPLLTMIQVTFPERVSTVGDAVNEVLRYSGYQLTPKAQQSSALITVLSKPLPLVDKQIGPMTTEDALLVLVGKRTFTLDANAINRTVNFRLIASTNKITTKSK